MKIDNSVVRNVFVNQVILIQDQYALLHQYAIIHGIYIILNLINSLNCTGGGELNCDAWDNMKITYKVANNAIILGN